MCVQLILRRVIPKINGAKRFVENGVYYARNHRHYGAALRALTEPCMSRSPIVHYHFMLLFMNE